MFVIIGETAAAEEEEVVGMVVMMTFLIGFLAI
jgi:hypothetical protein